LNYPLLVVYSATITQRRCAIGEARSVLPHKNTQGTGDANINRVDKKIDNT